LSELPDERLSVAGLATDSPVFLIAQTGLFSFPALASDLRPLKVMDPSYIPALAALGGAALGGFTSFATSWTTLRVQMKANNTASSKARRQKLYRQFISEASRMYGDALIHNELQLAGLIGLYSLISRMRILSSAQVIENAVLVTQTISDIYRQPNKTPEELEEMIHNDHVDLLSKFSEACREEFETNLPL
jgi:hypothetical protein